SANYSSNTVTVRLGQANGLLGAATNFSVGGSLGPIAPALGDLNGDGKLDLVVANYAGSSASVLLGNGLGGLLSPVVYAMGTNPWSIALGDLNGDGKLDVVTGNYGSSNLS